MKTKSQQPAHTKGEIFISKERKDWENLWDTHISITDENGEKGAFGIIYPANGESSQEHAQRIVKAVNMHDELIKVLQDWTNECVSNVSGFTTIDAKRKSERKVIERALSLLKQAEQK